MTDYLITPSPELREQWLQSPHDALVQAAQWGADQELEACCNWLPKLPPWSGEDLRRDRRPKQPTPKELALLELADVYDRDKIDDFTYDTIRVALEALPE
jgi:hypothetical protein